jgi:type IV pilus assembly protein PilB
MLTEEVLVSALSRQFKIPYMQVDKYKIPKEVIKLVPYEIAKKNILIPLHKIGQLLTIGMINPQNTEPIEELKRVTGLKVKFVICKLSEIKEAIRVLYETKEVSTQMTTALKIQKKTAPSEQTKTGMSISELKLPTRPDETGVIKTPAIATISTADGQAKVNDPTKTQVSSVAASESQKNIIQLTEEKFELAYREVSAKLPVLWEQKYQRDKVIKAEQISEEEFTFLSSFINE